MSEEKRSVKRILLLGATGRIGKHTLGYALSKGYEVVALVRSPEKITVSASNLKVVKGTPENPDDLMRAIDGCDAVVSALGVQRASEAPWAKSLSSPMFLTTSIGNCLAAMQAKGLRRIVVLTGIGTGDSFPYAPAFMRFLIRATRLRELKKDFDGEEALLQKSDMDWTSVRAVGLTLGKATKKLIVSYDNHPKPSASISRKHVAHFLVNCLQDEDYFQKAPVISER
jgi:uncharacterized protein YbjT (DUF2867 family)